MQGFRRETHLLFLVVGNTFSHKASGLFDSNTATHSLYHIRAPFTPSAAPHLLPASPNHSVT